MDAINKIRSERDAKILNIIENDENLQAKIRRIKEDAEKKIQRLQEEIERKKQMDEKRIDELREKFVASEKEKGTVEKLTTFVLKRLKENGSARMTPEKLTRKLFRDQTPQDEFYQEAIQRARRDIYNCIFNPLIEKKLIAGTEHCCYKLVFPEENPRVNKIIANVTLNGVNHDVEMEWDHDCTFIGEIDGLAFTSSFSSQETCWCTKGTRGIYFRDDLGEESDTSYEECYPSSDEELKRCSQQ